MTALGTATLWLAEALVVLSVLVLMVGLYRMARMPALYARLRMASRAVLLGIALFVAAFVVVTGDPTIIWEPAILYRIVSIGAFLLLTTPFATRVIRGAADRRRRGHREP